MEDLPAEPASALEVVLDNAPPTLSAPDTVVEVGEWVTLQLYPSDPEGDEINLRIEGLPAGAVFDPRVGEITWRPTRADIGEYRFVMIVSDETHQESYTGHIQVEPRSWAGWLVPGFGWRAMAVGTPIEQELKSGPLTVDHRGKPVFQGPVFDLELWSAGAPGSQDGPTRSRIYTNIGLLRGPQEGAILRYGGGFDLSLGGDTLRRWWIPSSGVEVEILHPSEGGNPARINPHFGLWIYSDESVSLQASCGYAYAPRQVEAFSGAECATTVHWASW